MTVPARRPPTSRRAREAAIAVVLLPVLLLVGILVGTKVFGGNSSPATTVASGTTPSPSRTVVGPVAPTSAVPVGPVAPSPTAVPAPTTAAPAPTTAAPAPTVQATTAAPTPAATTAAPAPSPTASSGSGTTTEAGGSTDGAVVVSKAPVPHAGATVVFGRGSANADVRAWQTRMAARGWNIHIDGIYGPQTASVAKRFQAEKHLTADGLVGPQTWAAAWKLPVTPP